MLIFFKIIFFFEFYKTKFLEFKVNKFKKICKIKILMKIIVIINKKYKNL
jgi:hypothetical protein